MYRIVSPLLFVGLLRPPFAVVVGVDAEAPVDGEAIGDRRLRDLDAVLGYYCVLVCVLVCVLGGGSWQV